MITLYEFAIACYLFRNNDDYEKSYLKFLDKTKLSIDLNKDEHLHALMVWLNDWRDRIATDSILRISQEILSWYNKFDNTLFPLNKELSKLSDLNLNEAFNAYKSLMKIDGIGATIASKVLFAVRPNSLVPWDTGTRKNLRDNKIREKLKIISPINSYRDYLDWLRSLVNELEKHCLSAGFQLSELPGYIGANPDINITMLLNEFIFIKVGKYDWQPPDINKLKQWIK